MRDSIVNDMRVRCPKCNIVYHDINPTVFKTSNLPILSYSNSVIVFECMNCKTHVPVRISYDFNIYHASSNMGLVGKNLWEGEV